MNDTYLEDAVSTGLDWLDEHRPGWARAINLDRFNIRMTNSCVVGQINASGEYEYIGNCETGVVYDEAKGFDLPDYVAENVNDAWNYLNQLWIDAIEERKAMRIGEPQREIIMDPVESPVPERIPDPEPEPEKVPEKVPERKPEKVPA